MTTDTAVVEPSVILVIACLNKGIKQFEEKIEAVMALHPEAYLFRGLPAAGPAMAPRLVELVNTR